MSVGRTSEWHPPVKDHGGENIQYYFSLLLVSEIVGAMCAHENNFFLPIAVGASYLDKMREEITFRLKENGNYFYEPEGSIFMDYKIMLSQALEQEGIRQGVLDPTEAGIVGYQTLKELFHPSMSTEAALYLARTLVANWDWS